MASSGSKQPLRGILKKPKARPAPSQDPSHDQVREIAVAHATIIQQQKAVEAEILNAIIRLLDFPLVRDEPTLNASSPASSDVVEFKNLVRAFQPTDYDDLIEERNACGHCGYSLCAKPRKKLAGSGTWKLVNKGRTDFKIMPKKELEKWCSEDCARRALYVRVQLSETAAWERVGIPDIQIDLMDEDKVRPATEDGKLADDMGKLRLDEERKMAEDSSALALERGEPKRKAGVETLADFDIQEKTAITAPVAPSRSNDDDDSHLLMEGYKPARV